MSWVTTQSREVPLRAESIGISHDADKINVSKKKKKKKQVGTDDAHDGLLVEDSFLSERGIRPVSFLHCTLRASGTRLR